jgi:hypothetical protein
MVVVDYNSTIMVTNSYNTWNLFHRNIACIDWSTLIMKLLILLCMFFVGCATQPQPKVIERVVFVDIQTYMEWGTTKLVPIGRRPIPSEQEICSNPLWINSAGCQNGNNN